MPKGKTILETMNDSPYKDYTLNFLTSKSVGAILNICKMLDEKYKIPQNKDGELNPDSWINKNLLLGMEIISKKRIRIPK